MKDKLFIKKLLQVSLLASIGSLLMLWQFPYPGAPGIFKFEISKVPVLIGGFALGPWAGIAVLLIKNLIFLIIKFSPGELIGIPMNTINTAVFVLTSSYIYHRSKTLNYAVLSIFSGVITSTLVMIPANYYALPLFMRVFTPQSSIPSPEKIVELILFAAIPFNAMSGVINGIITFLVYKRIGKFIKDTGDLELGRKRNRNSIEGIKG
jgi:riboflavin transporter